MRPRDVTEAELAVLEVLWEHGERTVRELAETLYPAGGTSEFATVQKLCERLEGKEVISIDRSSRPKRCAARVDRADLSVRKLQAVADDLYEGSVKPLVSQLLRGGRFTAQEIESLRAEVERLESAKPKSTRRKRGR